MDQKQIVEDLIKYDGIIGRVKVAKRYGITETQARDVMAVVSYILAEGGLPMQGSANVEEEEEAKGKTIEEMRDRYDIVKLIKTTAESIPDEEYYTNHEFLTMCKLGKNNKYRDIINRPIFDKYKGKPTGGPVHWGNPVSIAKLKEEGIFV